MIDSVRMTFTALREAGAPPAGELKVLKTTIDERVYLGLDDLGRPHLLVVTGEADPPSSDIATLEIGSRKLSIGGAEQTMLDVSCLFEALAEVFDHFVVAIVEQLRGVDTEPEVAVTLVLEKWRQFLMPAAGPPGRDKLAAVFGELILLCDVVASDARHRVDCWVGPFGARHDIRRGAIAVEVKTTRSHTSRVVTIHGEDQLVEPDGGELYLHMVRLEEAPDAGQSVSTLVDSLLGAGVIAEDLFTALAAVGVPPADLPHADHVRFEVRERLTIPVDTECPRIVPETFVGGARPVGVVDVAYRIDLDHVLDRALDDRELASVIAGLAGADAV